MSYALECKEELTHVVIETEKESKILLNAIIHNGFTLSLSSKMSFKLNFETPSNPITRFIIKLLLQVFPNINYNLYQRQVMRFNKPVLFSIFIEDGDRIIKEFKILEDDTEIKRGIIDNETLKKAYLRGCFIVGGSVNDPKTSNYHLEFQTSIDREAIFIQTLINSFCFNDRISKRKDKYVIYLKDKDSICDILRIIGVNVQVFKMEEDIIKRKVIADAKRKVNFDIANQSKTNEANKNIFKYIKYLEKYYPLEKLDPKLVMVMEVRKNNMEASLTELCDILKNEYNENISKSGLNHRFRKIKEIALEYREKRNKNDRY